MDLVVVIRTLSVHRGSPPSSSSADPKVVPPSNDSTEDEREGNCSNENR